MKDTEENEVITRQPDKSPRQFFAEVRQAIRAQGDPFAVARPEMAFEETRPMAMLYDPKCRW